MRIVIVGAGQVGFHLAKVLSEEDQDVVVIDSDQERVERTADYLDVLAIHGNGASIPVLERAGTRGARLFLAVTNLDEVNILGSLGADALGVPTKVARVSNPEFFMESRVMSTEDLHIDLMINPEREAAWETFLLLRTEAASELVRFADGKVYLIGLRVLEGAPVAGKELQQLGDELRGIGFTTVAITRDGETEIPTGSSRIEVGDHLYLMSPASAIDEVPRLAGYADFQLRRVMIAGGSQEAVYLARHLEDAGISSVILDKDRNRCVELSEELPETLVLHGDATDLELLEMEGVAGVDGFFASTDHDEVNMLSSLLAKSAGARKVVSLLNKLEYMPLVSRVGIDAAVSPRMSAVNTILRYLHLGSVSRVVALKEVDAQAVELTVNADSSALGRSFTEIPFPAGGLVGAIIRDDDVIAPRGRDTVQAGDRVILFALPDVMPRLERLFA